MSLTGASALQQGVVRYTTLTLQRQLYQQSSRHCDSEQQCMDESPFRNRYTRGTEETDLMSGHDKQQCDQRTTDHACGTSHMY